MSVDWRRQEFEAALPRWKLVDDMADEVNLDSHLPMLNPQDTSPDNRARNQMYRDRASFTGFTRITLQGLVGAAFEDDPQITLPGELEYLLKNADGTGVDLYQQMQACVGQVLRKGRAGLFVTMPPTGGDVSRADVAAGRFVATIHMIDAARIINWWTKTDGAETYLAGVVFTDSVEMRTGFEAKHKDARRALVLDDAGNYFDQLWVKADEGKDEWLPQEPIYPTQSNGQLWRRIPFFFVGAERNAWEIQNAPLYSLATKNRDHYRNSADHEESLWFAGQAQPWARGLDATALEEMKAAGVYIGSRQLIVADSFAFASAEPNTAVRQAMLDKMAEMAAIGARFLQPGTVAKTATQSSGELKASNSVLSLVCSNVEDAYQWACEQAALFMKATGEIVIEIQRGFMEPEVTAELQREMRENFLAGVIGPMELFTFLQRAGLISSEKTLEEYREELDARGMIGNGASEPVA
jgi:hypothetical protein